LSSADKAVENPQDFYGQRAVVRRIFSRLGTERPPSVAVIGGLKTGKTSLINTLFHPSIQEEYLDEPKQYVVLKIMADQDLFRDADGFISGLNQQLGVVHGDNHYNTLKKNVEGHHHSGRRLIFLMDDFHLITSNSNFPL